MEGLPGATAGLVKGDLVVAVNGVSVMGRDVGEISSKELRGLTGGAVRLTVAKLDGTETEVTLVRVPYPPHMNPSSDVFSYTVPGDWRMDPRYAFPLQWAPAVSHHGVEDLAFTPNFEDANSPEYHSYVFFWWLEGQKAFSAEELQSDMLLYFRGLAAQRGQNHGFTPDASKVAATYKADAPHAHLFGGVQARSFSGSVTIYDTRGRLITLHSEVLFSVCPGTDHTALFFGMSLEPRKGPLWKQLDAVRDSFRCSR